MGNTALQNGCGAGLMKTKSGYSSRSARFCAVNQKSPGGSHFISLESSHVILRLWVSNPKQQIAYLGVKYWARLYCPEVILGVYSPDEVEQRTEREINQAPAQRMSVAEITSGTDITTSAQDSALNIDSLADDFRDRIERAESVDAAKAIRADLDKEKAVLGTVLFTELKGKAVQRYFMVDARNKVEAAINSLPNPGEPEAVELFAKAEGILNGAKRHLDDELYDQFRITLDDMKPEYVG